MHLAGNPNAGKSTLFNRLTGLKARVGNYPGITVERKAGPVRCAPGLDVELVDVPGTYSLSARSPEEQIAVSTVLGEVDGLPDAVVVVIDATALTRNLYLALQIMETGLPTVLALNMMDRARAEGLAIDASALSDALGTPVVPISASRGEGLDALREALSERLRAGDAMTGAAADVRTETSADGANAASAAGGAPLASAATCPRVAYGDAVEDAIDAVLPAIAEWRPDASGPAVRAWALWALLSLGDDELRGVPDAVRERVSAAHARAAGRGEDLDRAIIAARYALLDRITEAVVRRPEAERRSFTDRLDAVLTHRVLGLLVFAVVMYIVFEALFTWSAPLMDGIGDAVSWTQDAIKTGMAPGALQALLADGVVAGVGNVVTFVPQIAFLFLLLGFLEDSGYLARVAFVIDKAMSKAGLHGRAFIPLMGGYACAVPAVMSTRTIESRRDRLATMLALPLMTCSARLPVYVLIIATVFSSTHRVWGIFSEGALALFAMYAVSALSTVGAVAVMRRTVLRGPSPALVLELPPYRMPSWPTLLRTTWDRVRTFLVEAGTIILAISIVLWALLAYPKNPAVTARFDAQRAEAAQSVASPEARAAKLRALSAEEAGAQLDYSFAGRVGHAIEPALRPLGFDWRIGVGLIAAFAARETFVSTLGTMFGLANADETSQPLHKALATATNARGAPLMTPLAGVSLMLFFVFACQCMSTIAIVRRESGSWKWPLLMFAYMTVLAYGASFAAYQIGSALGWGLG